MTAPKIDTQAPDMIHAAGERLLVEIDMLRDIAGTPDASSICDELRQWVRARIDDRLTSAAREAAAAQAMREAVDSTELVERINALSPLFVGSEIYVNREHVLEWITAISIMREAAALPLPDTTALDRLIAERVREAVEKATRDEIARQRANADSREAMKRRLFPARGSKEGQS